MSLRDHRYLIVAGAPRCGTTSIFDYLDSHPDVCGSRIKESGFFYPRSFPLGTWSRYEDGPERFGELFSRCHAPSGLRLEATPGYLYVPETARRIRASLPQVKIVISLREPVSRLVSTLHFGILMGAFAPSTSFQAYLDLLRAQSEDSDAVAPHLRGLRNGRYSRFLPVWFDTFGRENVLVTRFEELNRDARATMIRVCEFAGLNSGHFQTHSLKVRNKSYDIRHAGLFALFRRMQFRKMGREMAGTTSWKASLEDLAHRTAGQWLLRASTKPAQKPIIRPEDRRFLEDYYSEEKSRLAALLGTPVPW